MLDVIESLANLSGLRERDALDTALVNAVHGVISVRSVAICRAIGEAGNERWRIAAQIGAGQAQHTSDPAWAPLESLPELSAHPYRLNALRLRQIQYAPGEPARTFFPLDELSAGGILEIISDKPLDSESQRLVSGVLRIFLNVGNLLDYGERDALTELLNRKTFDSAFLKATLERQQRAPDTPPLPDRREPHPEGSYWLAVIDIDHFKRVNDTYGHLIGDEVLLLLARLMRNQFRFHDQLYRFGGEEFVVLMRCDSAQEAAKVLERMRSETQEHLFPQVGRITVSIGFSEVRPGDSPSGAFERADKAVYYAKEHGRNQVCGYADLIASGALSEQAANVGDMELF